MTRPQVKKNDPNTPGKKIDDFWETSQKAGIASGCSLDTSVFRCLPESLIFQDFSFEHCQEILQDPKALLDRLFNFDKDNIPDRVIQALPNELN